LDAHFVCSDIYDLPNVLSGQFDIVFTSYGVLGWLPDVQQWGKVVGHFLKPGGVFYIIDGHPFKDVFDYPLHATSFDDVRVTYSYFSKEPIRGEVQGTYADRNANATHTTTYEWNHQLGDILNALIAAGLTIEFLHEFPFCNWKCFPDMEQGEDGWWRMKGLEDSKIPLMFSLKATK
jgi:SAM-dependent methyltransferase